MFFFCFSSFCRPLPVIYIIYCYYDPVYHIPDQSTNRIHQKIIYIKYPYFHDQLTCLDQQTKKESCKHCTKKCLFLLITIGIIKPNGLNAKIFPNRFVTTASVDKRCLYVQNRLISLNKTKFTWEVSYPVSLPYRSLNNTK